MASRPGISAQDFIEGDALSDDDKRIAMTKNERRTRRLEARAKARVKKAKTAHMKNSEFETPGEHHDEEHTTSAVPFIQAGYGAVIAPESPKRREGNKPSGPRTPVKPLGEGGSEDDGEYVMTGVAAKGGRVTDFNDFFKGDMPEEKEGEDKLKDGTPANHDYETSDTAMGREDDGEDDEEEEEDEDDKAGEKEEMGKGSMEAKKADQQAARQRTLRRRAPARAAANARAVEGKVGEESAQGVNVGEVVGSKRRSTRSSGASGKTTSPHVLEGLQAQSKPNLPKSMDAQKADPPNFPAMRQDRASAAKQEVKQTGAAADSSTPAPTKKKPLTLEALRGIAQKQGVTGGTGGYWGKNQAKKSLFGDYGCIGDLMKSIGVLAASANSVSVAEDMAWDAGMGDDTYQDFRSLMRSFPPSMWSFLKRAADKTISPNVAIRHIAECIGEVNKALAENDDLAKSVMEYQIEGLGVVDTEFVPRAQEALAASVKEATEEARKSAQSQCPTHAYTTQGYAYTSNLNGVCHCQPTHKGIIAKRAMELLMEKAQKEVALGSAIDTLGIDTHTLRLYIDAAA